ncbi:MAG TPA: formylmethanofuran dehydrogenase subunit B [Anaerolineae bacterium]|nr:formylmethanofuran dehydrogenase subunit B [Anaerolineae bacterium]
MSPRMSAIRVIENVVCSFCGCLCDDIVVEVDDGRITRVRKVCANGRGLFTHYDPAPRRPTVDGREVAWEEAVAEAAQILDRADSPLIYGLSSTATEAQRKAVALADKLGAMIDTTSSVCHGPTSLAMQAVGEPTCTLGEVRNRADLLLFWGCNPAVSHIRHFARYSVTPKGTLTPKGRRDRTVVVVDVRPTASTRAADLFLQVQPGADFEVLATLRALLQGAEIEAETVGGVPTAQLQDLVERMRTCRFGVAFMGMGLTQSRGRDLNVSELFTLVAELNQYARFCVIPMRGHGNVAGADQVLTWQSGYPFAVSFARGYPRYGPGEFSTVDVLARGEADAALILASDPVAHFPSAAARQLEHIPTIVLDPMPTLTAQVARVVFPTACYGVDAAGTAYRMDGVPIRLRPVLPPARPTDVDVLERIIEAVTVGN